MAISKWIFSTQVPWKHALRLNYYSLSPPPTLLNLAQVLCCTYLTFVLWSSATLAPLGLPLPRPSGLLLNFSGAEPTAEPDVVPCILRRLLSCNRLGARSRAVAAAAAAGVWTRGAVPMPMPRSKPRSPSFAAKYLYSARSHLQFSC